MKKIERPEVKGLYPGKFGKYYKDAELTQYVGRFKNNKWVPAKKQPTKSQKGNAGTAAPSSPTTSTEPQPPEIDTSTPEGRRKDHAQTVQFNMNSKFLTMWNAGVDVSTKTFKLGAAGHEDFMYAGDDVDDPTKYPEFIPIPFMIGIQQSLGRKSTDKDSPAVPTKVVMKDFNKFKHADPQWAGCYSGNSDKIFINSLVNDASSFSKPLDQLNKDDINTIATLTHETIHSASPRHYKSKQSEIIRNDKVLLDLEEGVTEYMARNLTEILVNTGLDEPNAELDAEKFPGSYQSEVESIAALVKYGELDPIEIFQTGETVEEFLRLAAKHQNRYLATRLLQAGFDEETTQEYVALAYMRRAVAMPVQSKEFRNALNYAAESEDKNSPEHKDMVDSIKKYFEVFR